MDYNVIANIKTLALDMINEAGSGHPGITLGAAPILYTLFANHMNINVNDEHWINRDRFVMSAGHGSALLYATLYMAGYNITKEDLANYRQLNSKTPGHPEYLKTPGVDISTGSLGQGFASAVGMAISSKILGVKTKVSNGKKLIDYNVYVLCSDGDLMEGISSEAASIAGTLKLNNLIVLYDSNNISLDGKTNLTFNENIRKKFEAMGWNSIYVKNGDNIKSISKAISKAKSSNKPTIIEIKTIIGKGSQMQNTNLVHGNLLKQSDLENIKANLFIPNENMFINDELREYMRKKIMVRVDKKYREWGEHFNNLKQDKDYQEIFMKNDFNLLNHDFSFENDFKEEMRITNQRIMQVISDNVFNFIGGSADTAMSSKTYLDGNDLTFNNYEGKNIWFGVRENAMGAILNGLATTYFKPYGATFLAFADNLKPSIRMSCLMNLPVTYIFTHDSVSIGQDGATHQPVEQLAMLRSIPNLAVFRPCDANEIIGCWNVILNSNSPAALIISKEEVPILNVTKKEQVDKGAYIVENEHKKLDGILIATGTEVHTALNIARDLYLEHDIELRVISMPCKELFLKQPKEYQERIIPTGYKKIVIEAGSKFGWEGFVYNDKYLFTVDNFGVSAKKDDVLKYCNFDYNTIKEKILNLYK